MSDETAKDRVRTVSVVDVHPPRSRCHYGSCDKTPQHAGVHRCRCGKPVDEPGRRCAWHTSPDLRTVIADRDALLAEVEAVRGQRDGIDRLADKFLASRDDAIAALNEVKQWVDRANAALDELVSHGDLTPSGRHVLQSILRGGS